MASTGQDRNSWGQGGRLYGGRGQGGRLCRGQGGRLYLGAEDGSSLGSSFDKDVQVAVDPQEPLDRLG